ncbi:DoxX family protein [Candidatus Saccharibacteria bacterium]|nr:DoxX family protein [Candidatus Saccharibacteria bacterium]
MVEITLPAATADIGLLLVRLIVGYAFIVAARNKSRDVRKFAKSNGLPLSLAVVVMITEMTAGFALLLGIYPQLAALAIMVLMTGTIRLHIFKWKSPYWAAKGGWEYDLMLFAMALVILVWGGGEYVVLETSPIFTY